ncbi:MAG: tetratricopeptide repeat protein [Elusimicrobia bacterium]|nr:tetratricopeptide repeat protein [Elusimicrobiota bacterium]
MNTILIPLLSVTTFLFAADPPRPTGAEEAVGRETPTRIDSQAKTRKTADEALARKAVEGAPVTYQQVLADPDNVDLNYRYAQSQIRSGDVRGAAATLERILMVDPSLHRVRLLYALVLFRLDNLSEAGRELDALTGLALPANLRAELDDLKSLITKRRRSTHVDVLVGFGFDYDSNISATPASEQMLFANQFIDITPKNPETADTAMIGLGNVRVTHDPGTQNGHEVFGGLGWYRAEQTLQDRLDLQVFSFDMGTALKFGRNTITPKVNWDQVYLSEETFLERPAIGMKFERAFTERLSADFEARIADDRYSKTSEIPRAEERSGHQWDLVWGVGWVATPVMRIRGGYTLTGKAVNDERFRYNAYDRHSLNASLSYLLGKGMFALVSGAMNIDRYDHRDPMIGIKYRDDITFRSRLTFGAPLGFIHKYFKDFVFTQSYEYYRAESDITNYAYDNNKLSSLVTYKWGW